VVRVRYILPRREDFEACKPILGKYSGDIRPAATMLVAGLLEERIKIEIEVTAHKA
jgi:enamine deaminase RidA (YjgF/YER057c/UK114 family)